MDLRLDGKRALVTGASSGLGEHFAKVLAEAGAEVTLAARRLDKVEANAAALRAAGHEAEAAEMDVADAQSVAALFAGRAPFDILINNAGVAGAGGGSIVNIASILGLRVSGHLAAYAASKAGLVQLTKTLALEWARHGIRVNALCPGYIETPINAEFFATEAGKALIGRIPQRRLGSQGDLDAPLLLLASDRSAYMTGSVIAVDGGHLVSGL